MNIEIQKKIECYPSVAKERFLSIRSVIYQVAEEESLGVVNESLKWGEPSYSAKGGSPIRIDWKPKYPHQISLYVNCNTCLLETYRELFGEILECKGNREITLSLEQPIPMQALRSCIYMALRYHQLKHLPLLGY